MGGAGLRDSEYMIEKSKVRVDLEEKTRTSAVAFHPGSAGSSEL